MNLWLVEDICVCMYMYAYMEDVCMLKDIIH